MKLLAVKTGIINLPQSFSSHSCDDLLPHVSKLNVMLRRRIDVTALFLRTSRQSVLILPFYMS